MKTGAQNKDHNSGSEILAGGSKVWFLASEPKPIDNRIYIDMVFEQWRRGARYFIVHMETPQNNK